MGACRAGAAWEQALHLLQELIVIVIVITILITVMIILAIVTYIYIYIYIYIYMYICMYIYIYIYRSRRFGEPPLGRVGFVRPISILRFWISEGLTQADS